jgi:hypothetical protein
LGLDLRIMVATAVSFGGQKPVTLAWVLPATAPVPPAGPARSAA